MSKLFKSIYPVLLLILMSSLSGYSQDDAVSECIDWESFPTDATTIIGASSMAEKGDTVLRTDLVDVTLDSFHYRTSNQGFLNLIIENGSGFGNQNYEDGNVAYPSNINLVFNFSKGKNSIAKEVCFDFVDGGGIVNLRLNDYPTLKFNDFDDISFLTAAQFGFQFEFDIEENDDYAFPAGTVCITGPIERLEIGGQEMFIDNICYDVLEGEEPVCSLTDFKVTPSPCTSSGIYFSETTFQTEDNEGSYTIRTSDGQEFGPFSYAEGFNTTIGPFFPDDGKLEYIITDIETGCADTTYATPDCPCEPGVLDVEIVKCLGSGFFDLNINLLQLPSNISASGGIEIFVDGKSQGIYAVADFPIILERAEVLTEAVFFPVKACYVGSSNSDCCTELLVDRRECPDVKEGCLSFEGVANGIYGATSGLLPGDLAFIRSNIRFYTLKMPTLVWTELFGDLKVREIVAPELPFSDGQVLEFDRISTAIDFSDYDDVVETVEIDIKLLEGPLRVGANGEEPVLIQDLTQRTYQLGGGIKVKVRPNPSSDTETTLVFDGPGTINSLLLGAISMLADNFCINTAPQCSIDNLAAVPGPCQADGSFFIDLSFDSDNTSEQFLVYVNQTAEEEFRYADLPVRLGPFSNQDGEVLTVKVSDTENESCTEAINVDLPECKPICQLDKVSLSDINCIPATQSALGIALISFTIEITPESNQGKFYVISANDGFRDTIYYEAPQSVYIPKKPNQTEGTITICTLDDPNCCEVVNFVLPCSVSECTISNLKAQPTPCDIDGLFYVDLSFEFSKTDQTFTLFQNDQPVQTYTYGELELPIRVGPFDAATDEAVVFRVQDDTDSDCFEEVDLPLVDCEPINCTIRQIQAKALPCKDNGTYMVEIDFEHENNSGFFYVIHGRDSLLFEYGSLPIEVGPFDDTAESELIVSDKTRDCTAAVDLPEANCTPEVCSFLALEAQPTSCENDSFFIELVFETTVENPDRSYLLLIEGESFGTYSYAQNDLKVGPFFGDGERDFDIVLLDLDDPANCTSSITLPPVKCEEVCPLTDLVVEIASCDPDTGIYIAVAPIFEDPTDTTDSYNVFIFSDYRGTFKASEFPIELGPFENLTSGDASLSIMIEKTGAENDDSCRMFADISVPLECFDTCTINSFQAFPVTCNPDGSISYRVNLTAENGVGAPFIITGPSGFSKEYPLGEESILIDLFLPQGNKEAELTVCSSEFGECCLTTALERLDCTLECPINNILPYQDSCVADNALEFYFQVDIIFNGNYAAHDGFMINHNDQSFGPFSFDELPITVGPVAIAPDNSNASLNKVFILQGIGNNDCSAVFEVAPSFCPKAEVWPGDANNDNEANHIDLINVGIAFGSKGPARSQRGSAWDGIPTLPWLSEFLNGLNYKFADCNGDGVIDIKDKAVIATNYGQRHGPAIEIDTLPETDLDPPVFLDLPEFGELPAGTPFEIPIILGTRATPVKDIYGFAFTIDFDEEYIDPESVQISYPTSWFGQENVNILTIDKVFTTEGKVEIAMTRNDQNDVSGFGPVAYLRGIIDDIAFLHFTPVSTEATYGYSLNSGPVKLGSRKADIKIIPENDPIFIRNTLSVYPNPASDRIYLDNAAGAPIDEVRVYDISGKQIGGVRKEVREINVSDWPEGVYLLQMKIGGILVNEKIIKR